MRRANLLICLLFSACGPSNDGDTCRYAEIKGTCALVEATDFDPHGSPGRIRVRYRLVQSDAPELGNHVVVVANADLDHHQQTLKYFRAEDRVTCTVGVRAQGTDCPDLRVKLALPPPDPALKLTYDARVVAERRARVDQDVPFGEGESTSWP